MGGTQARRIPGESDYREMNFICCVYYFITPKKSTSIQL